MNAVTITSLDEAWQASYKAEAMAQLVEEGFGKWHYENDEQRAVGTGMDILLEYLSALRNWLDEENCGLHAKQAAAPAPAVANRVSRKRKAKVRK